MSDTHKAGDVAMISHTDGTKRRAMYATDGTWVCFDMASGGHTPLAEEIHPLVVVDVSDVQQLAPMHDALRGITGTGWYYDDIQHALGALGETSVVREAPRAIRDEPNA